MRRFTLPLLVAVAAAPLAGQQILVEAGGSAVGVALGTSGADAWRLDGAAAAIAGRAGVTELRLECAAGGGVLSFAATLDTWHDVLDVVASALADRSASSRQRQGAAPPRVSRSAPRSAEAVFDSLLKRVRSPEEAGSECRLATGALRREDAEPQPPANPQAAIDPLAAGDAITAAETAADRRAPHVTVAVAGPVDSVATAAFLRRRLRLANAPLATTFAPAPRPRRLQVERPSVTAWIGHAYPVAPGTSGRGIALLAFHLREQLRALLGPESLLDATAAVVTEGGRPWLLVRLLADASAAGHVDRTARETLAAARVRLLEPAAFRELVVRFRGDRLRRLAAPEARARAALLEHPHAPTAPRDGEFIGPEALASAAAALGPPSIARVGPRAALDPSRGSP